MGLIKKLFSPKRPTLAKADIGQVEKVAEFVVWFIKNEPIANAISNRSSNIIFNEGYRPMLVGTDNDTELLNPNISSLPEWFVTKMFITLNELIHASKEEFQGY